MNELERRIWALEDALHQAIWTVEFLHGCLIQPELYHYDYPDQTEVNLEYWRKLTPPPALCAHSVYQPGCPECESRRRKMLRAERGGVPDFLDPK